MAGVNSGTALGFKTGTQASVNSIIANGRGAVHGSFYLTNDTHRLYVGNSDGTLSSVNQGVITVASVSALPDLSDSGQRLAAQGQFYYAENEHVLCVASSYQTGNSNTQYWVQINPDHTVKTDTTAISTALTTNSDGVKVTSTVSDWDGYTTAHTASGDFTIKAGANINIDLKNGRVIELSTQEGTTYTLTAETNSLNSELVDIKLTDTHDSTNVQTITLAKGAGNVTPKWNSVTQQLEFDGGGLRGSTMTISQNATSGALTLLLTDSGGFSASQVINPIIQIGDSSPQNVKGTWDNQTKELTFDLDVYTTTEIDDMLSTALQAAEGMYFAGIIGDGTGAITPWSGFVGATNIRSGATYKVVTSADITEFPDDLTFTSSTVEGKAKGKIMNGDTIIITARENNSGYIDFSDTTNNLKFTIIPSGDDPDIYYTPNFSTEKSFRWTRSGAAALADSHVISITEGTNIDITGTYATSGQTRTQTLNIAHETITTTPTTGTGVVQSSTNAAPTFNAITGLTFDNGHVTGYETTQLTLWSNNLQRVVSTAVVNTPVDANPNDDVYPTPAVAVRTSYIPQTGGNGPQGNNKNDWQISSNSLSLSVANAGDASGSSSSIADVRIEMLWGSFS